MMFIHEEVVSGRFASEMDGVGHFDVIHTDDGYQLHQSDGGMLIDTFGDLESAVAQGKIEARAFDRAHIAELRRAR